MTVYSYTGELEIINCPSCHMDFGLTRAYYRHLRETGEAFCCPAGHSGLHWTPGPSDATKLKEAQAREVALRDQLHAAEAEAEKTRQALLRDRHRFANGVCPCCNRTFQNVLNHMRGEHPDYDVATIEAKKYGCSCGRSFESYAGLRRHQSAGRGQAQRWYGKAWTDTSLSDYSRHLTKV